LRHEAVLRYRFHHGIGRNGNSFKHFASATARYIRGVRYATSRDVVISTTSVRASSASRIEDMDAAIADTVNVGPVAQTDVGIVKATSEKANVTASPIIVVGISEASLERGNGRRTMRLSQSYTYSQLLQQRAQLFEKNLVSCGPLRKGS